MVLRKGMIKRKPERMDASSQGMVENWRFPVTSPFGLFSAFDDQIQQKTDLPPNGPNMVNNEGTGKLIPTCMAGNLGVRETEDIGMVRQETKGQIVDGLNLKSQNPELCGAESEGPEQNSTQGQESKDQSKGTESTDSYDLEQDLEGQDPENPKSGDSKPCATAQELDGGETEKLAAKVSELWALEQELEGGDTEYPGSELSEPCDVEWEFEGGDIENPESELSEHCALEEELEGGDTKNPESELSEPCAAEQEFEEGDTKNPESELSEPCAMEQEFDGEDTKNPELELAEPCDAEQEFEVDDTESQELEDSESCAIEEDLKMGDTENLESKVSESGGEEQKLERRNTKHPESELSEPFAIEQKLEGEDTKDLLLEDSEPCGIRQESQSQGSISNALALLDLWVHRKKEASDTNMKSEGNGLDPDTATMKEEHVMLKARLPLNSQIINLKERQRLSKEEDVDIKECCCAQGQSKVHNAKLHYHCAHCPYVSQRLHVIRHEAMVHHIQHRGFTYFQCPICEALLTQVSEYSRHLAGHERKIHMYEEEVQQFIVNDRNLCSKVPRQFGRPVSLKKKMMVKPKGKKITFSKIKGQKIATRGSIQKEGPETTSITGRKKKEYSTLFPLNSSIENVAEQAGSLKKKMDLKFTQVLYDVRAEGIRVTMRTPKKMKANNLPEPNRKGIFKCPKCPFKTASASGLTGHLVCIHQVLGPITYKCSLCKNATVKRFDFGRHCESKGHMTLVEKHLKKEIKPKAVKVLKNMKGGQSPRKVKKETSKVATKKAESSTEKAGSSKEKALCSTEKAGSSKEKAVCSTEKGGSSKEKARSSRKKASSAREKASSAKDKAESLTGITRSARKKAVSLADKTRVSTERAESPSLEPRFFPPSVSLKDVILKYQEETLSTNEQLQFIVTMDGTKVQMKSEERPSISKIMGSIIRRRGKYYCPLCASCAVSDKKNLRHHLYAVHHLTRRCYSCEICDLQTSDKSALFKHCRSSRHVMAMTSSVEMPDSKESSQHQPESSRRSVSGEFITADEANDQEEPNVEELPELWPADKEPFVHYNENSGPSEGLGFTADFDDTETPHFFIASVKSVSEGTVINYRTEPYIQEDANVRQTGPIDLEINYDDSKVVCESDPGTNLPSGSSNEILTKIHVSESTMARKRSDYVEAVQKKRKRYQKSVPPAVDDDGDDNQQGGEDDKAVMVSERETLSAQKKYRSSPRTEVVREPGNSPEEDLEGDQQRTEKERASLSEKPTVRKKYKSARKSNVAKERGSSPEREANEIFKKPAESIVSQGLSSCSSADDCAKPSISGLDRTPKVLTEREMIDKMSFSLTGKRKDEGTSVSPSKKFKALKEGDKMECDSTAEASQTLDQYSTEVLYAELERRKNLYFCQCGLVFQSTPMFFIHRTSHNTANPLKCRCCDYVARNWVMFHTHFLNSH